MFVQPPRRPIYQRLKAHEVKWTTGFMAGAGEKMGLVCLSEELKHLRKQRLCVLKL